jgi:hypothetical protein
LLNLLGTRELEEGDVELDEGVHGEDQLGVGHHVVLHITVVFSVNKR